MSRAQLTSTVEQNTGGAVAPFVAGKNKIINGDFGIWQRGTSISQTASTTPYTADRWQAYNGANQANTISRQSTNDTTNLPFIQYCARFQRNNGQTGTADTGLFSSFETINSIPYAGKSVVISFYARAGANFSATSNFLVSRLYIGTGTDQNILSGYTGSSIVVGQNNTLTTTWQRFTMVGTIPTVTTEIALGFYYTPTGTAGANDYFEVTGVQLEAGSVATPFTTATGTLSGELAACQRYYYQTSNAGTVWLANGWASGTTNFDGYFQFPTTMRTAASVTATSGASYFYIAVGSTSFTTTTPTGFFNPSVQGFYLRFAGSGLTTGQGGISQAQSSSAVIMASAEL